MRPHSPETLDLADLAACRARLRAGSKSFTAAARLLPAAVRDAATVLYAFCREADDAVDLHHGGDGTCARLRARLDAVYAGAPQADPIDRALAAVVSSHAVPRALLDALIEGLEWDAQGRRYATLAELQGYAARVAGTVGAMMAVLMGVRSPAAIARACELGVAMQLTNIARDVGEDARAGRLYLPLAWMRAAGIDPEQWLQQPRITDRLRRVVQELLYVAEGLYVGVESGIAQLPAACRPGSRAARAIYAEIGNEVARAGYDSVSRRAVVPASRKARLLLQAFLPMRHASANATPMPLATNRFLVDAVAAAAPRRGAQPDLHGVAFPWWHLKAQALWLLELFERLERNERSRARAAHAQELTGP